MSDDNINSIDRWVWNLQDAILNGAAHNLQILQQISQDNTHISVEDMPRMQSLLAEQQRIIDQLNAMAEDIGGRTAANVGHTTTLIKAQLDAVNVAGSLGTFLANLEFFMNENPGLSAQLLTGLSRVPEALTKTLVQMEAQEFGELYDCVKREAKRRRVFTSPR